MAAEIFEVKKNPLKEWAMVLFLCASTLFLYYVIYEHYVEVEEYVPSGNKWINGTTVFAIVTGLEWEWGLIFLVVVTSIMTLTAPFLAYSFWKGRNRPLLIFDHEGVSTRHFAYKIQYENITSAEYHKPNRHVSSVKLHLNNLSVQSVDIPLLFSSDRSYESLSRISEYVTFVDGSE